MKQSPSSSPISSTIMIKCLLVILFTMLMGSCEAQLSTDFYKKACPKVFAAVKSVVAAAVAEEKRMGASLLRLHFHDCFVQLGGPSWEVKVGRRDSKSASLSGANSGALPPPTSTLSNLINRFSAVGLSVRDMVVLSGAHTIGKARCTTFKGRIYNDTNIDPIFAKKRQTNCPFTNGTKRDNNVDPLDHKTPNFFDNSYFGNLLQKKGLLHSDQVLYNSGATDSLVEAYAKNGQAFDKDFVAAMIRMGDIAPLTGSKGEIRKNCRKMN
ncbi:peroxidase 4-like isoform X2 [Salvia splendens]|uniref:peroxidase 4-like isoform X2 n=1 Tax=Salvia splendens TaxID=180675 RepID=UPI001C25E9C3|nr:peroxidase 4-like isoform X2 [Salvia splendens]